MNIFLRFSLVCNIEQVSKRGGLFIFGAETGGEGNGGEGKGAETKVCHLNPSANNFLFGSAHIHFRP